VRSNNINNLSDDDLLSNYFSTKDNMWLGLLLQRYTLLLLGTCMKYLKSENNAKDAVQQVFLKAINEIPKYKITYFKSWIYMVAKNHCLMQLRDKNKTTSITENEVIENEEVDIDSLKKKDEELNFLEASVSELNIEQRECIDLFYLQKKSYQEIVDTTSYTLMQVKSNIQNGKRNLKILIEKKRQFPNGK
jgi:RNA polymerase sigma-70 factor (ECF subfamily)